MRSWSGFAMQGDLIGKKCVGCIAQRALSVCLTCSQPQIRNTVEYHFGIGLLL